MKNWTILLLVAMVSTVGLSLTGCEREGPAERTGRQVDEAVRDTGRAIEDAGEDLQR